MNDKILGALVGLACGDAVGTTLEFKAPGTFEPISDMVGGGPFNLDIGQWTDDTSMALCLAHSLIHNQGFDPVDQMNRYCNWYHHGYMSSTGDCFDIGNTVVTALKRYLDTQEPYSGSTDVGSSGNGSLMRLAPIPMFYSHSLSGCIELAGDSSRTTHGSALCIDACRYFSSVLWQAFRSESKDQILFQNTYTPYTKEVSSISRGEFVEKNYSQIRGSGFAIESLEAALWCFYTSENFEEAILLAANLGNDADTTAAICGQVAGAFYGNDLIPLKWRNRLYMYDEIIELGLKLAEAP